VRTTITLDDDVAASLKALVRERGVSFKEAVNSALRAGLEGRRSPQRYRQQTYRLGLLPGIDLDRARELADALEDDEIVRKLEQRK
jgi:hypothetical protein